ncbi:MAG: phosphatase PAP2 family protein [Flavisolibacter sp.]
MKKWFVFSFLIWNFSCRAQSVDSSLAGRNPGHSKNGKGWIKVAAAVGYAGATYVCYRYIDQEIQDESQERKKEWKTDISRSVTSFGLGKVHTIAWCSTTAAAFLLRDSKLKQTVIIWGAAAIMNSVITNELKMGFQRHRPNTGDPYNTFDGAHGPGVNKSFPSAHTSNAFTAATVFATMYRNHGWVPVVAYGMASLVGLSRIYDNAHWASDVMTGAAVGFLSAKAMCALYKVASKRFLFLPTADLHQASLDIVYRF